MEQFFFIFYLDYIIIIIIIILRSICATVPVMIDGNSRNFRGCSRLCTHDVSLMKYSGSIWREYTVPNQCLIFVSIAVSCFEYFFSCVLQHNYIRNK